MLYALMGRIHAAVVRGRDEAGQGTIEYVGLMVLMATVLTGVVAVAGKTDQDLAKRIVEGISSQIGKVSGTK